MKALVKVYEFDSTETDYEAKEHFETGVGYRIECTSGMIVIVHPQSVKKIEIYEGDELIRTVQETRHGG